MIPRLRLKSLILLLSLSVSPLAMGGAGHIDTDGSMDFELNFRYVPTTAQIEDVKAAIRGANSVLCDATDGQIFLENVRLTGGTGDEDSADIWLHPQGGRSVVSFYYNGSGLGRSGMHIDLFQSAIWGDIIAHELGHLAFGLGDEYNEQSRWGGPCGIGPGIEVSDEQNHSMMQQPGYIQCTTTALRCRQDSDCPSGDVCEPILMSELTVTENHDLLQGDGIECPELCTDDDCLINYNSTTMRFEATQQTLAHDGDADWVTLQENYPFIVLPMGLPVEDRPSLCDTASSNINFIEDVIGSDQVLLLIDRSGSMDAPVEPESTESRLDFAKAAARAYVDLTVGRNADVAIVSFNDTARLDHAFELLDNSNISDYRTDIDALLADGTTAIGTALDQTSFTFDGVAAAGRTRTAMLLSDGENNTGVDPTDAAERLIDRGVRIFTIPVGDSADKSLLADIAGDSGGAMLDAPTGNELPAIYAELAARAQGESLVLPRSESAIEGNIIIERHAQGEKGEKALPIWEDFEFDVEAGAQRLNVMLSARNLDLDDWRPQFQLMGPDGEHFTLADETLVKYDPYYYIVQVPLPSPGAWRLRVSTATIGLRVFSYVLASVEGSGPDCLTDVLPRVAFDGDQVSINAAATYRVALEGVHYSGRVLRPDGSSIPLTFSTAGGERTVTANFSSFVGRGIYEVEVTCDATNATQQPGESIYGADDVPVVIESFKRVGRTSFFLDSETLPPCNIDDCDGDGIPNDQEDTGDLDGDGLPGFLDDDADGDDLFDGFEEDMGTDPTDPDSDNDGLLDGEDPDPTSYTANCGNSVVDADEDCDDGNQEDGDGCTATCESECHDPQADFDLPGNIAGAYHDSGDLSAIDSQLGAGAPFTALSGLRGITAMAYAPDSSRLFVATGDSDDSLYVLDLATDVVSSVGYFGRRASNIQAMDLAPEMAEAFGFSPGTLYGVSIDGFRGCSPNCLFAIDAEDGRAQPLASLNTSQVRGASFDPVTGELWLLDAANRQLMTIDATGAITPQFQVPVANQSQQTGLGTGFSLAHTCNGMLYTVDVNYGVLVVLDPIDKQGHWVGNYGDLRDSQGSFGIQGLDGLFDPNCDCNLPDVEDPPPASACTVYYRLSNSWPMGGNTYGFQAEVNISSDTPLNGWALAFSFEEDQLITALWNGLYTQVGSDVIVTNESYNGSIPAGQLLGFGFLGSFSSATQSEPTYFELNQQSCDVVIQ